MNYDLQIIEIGSDHFALFSSGIDEDGRLINLRYFMSAVPNFKQGGSMLFIKGSDKAIAVDLPPEAIYQGLRKHKETKSNA